MSNQNKRGDKRVGVGKIGLTEAGFISSYPLSASGERLAVILIRSFHSVRFRVAQPLSEHSRYPCKRPEIRGQLIQRRGSSMVERAARRMRVRFSPPSALINNEASLHAYKATFLPPVPVKRKSRCSDPKGFGRLHFQTCRASPRCVIRQGLF